MFARQQLLIILLVSITTFALAGFASAFSADLHEEFAHTSDEIAIFNGETVAWLNVAELNKLGTPANIDCGALACVSGINEDGSIRCSEPATQIFGAGVCQKHDYSICKGKKILGIKFSDDCKQYRDWTCIHKTYPYENQKGNKFTGRYSQSESTLQDARQDAFNKYCAVQNIDLTLQGVVSGDYTGYKCVRVTT